MIGASHSVPLAITYERRVPYDAYATQRVLGG